MALSLKKINCFYGKAHVLKDVSLHLQRGEILCLLGRNGAGKTTTLKAIMGLVTPKSGSIMFNGRELTKTPPHIIAKLGIAYVPQGRRIFQTFTVEENLKMGLLVRGGGQETLEHVLNLFPVLRERLKQRAGTLSGGEQQMLAIARALCTNPQLLLLDEPTEGLMPALVLKLLDIIKSLKQQNIGVLLVEQRVEAAFRVADRVALIEGGSIRYESTSDELASNVDVLLKYVGVKK
jgi:branched-chain amino acid transport system ATP-binding protein